MQVFIGEIVDGKMLNLVGVGQAATDGVKKADIIDVKKAAEQAQAAIVMAERSCSVPINRCASASAEPTYRDSEI